ncbi:MAG: pantoate--beta-alanine ligase [Ferruginibacter sp.]|nr:pantoate--beta-alanine ligase [Ferruginibacter sp.]
MRLYKTKKDLTVLLKNSKANNIEIGFVPTMGALHNGHISLVTKAKNESGLAVCSIFVNPTQFNDPKDFAKYPVTINEDIYLLEKAGCDVLFLPSVDEMYPDGLKTDVNFELGFLETILDGKFRPGHFQGVCQVMDRLLSIVLPDKLFMGQKDFQQCMVLKKMTAINFPGLQLIVCPTQRELDGLAMSSRNVRLSIEERQRAIKIFATLQFLKTNVTPGDVTGLKLAATNNLTQAGFKVDYVAIANAVTLQLLDNWDGNEPLVFLIAAFLNEVRLIDNMLLDE